MDDIQDVVEEIRSVGTINNVETLSLGNTFSVV